MGCFDTVHFKGKTADLIQEHFTKDTHWQTKDMGYGLLDYVLDDDLKLVLTPPDEWITSDARSDHIRAQVEAGTYTDVVEFRHEVENGTLVAKFENNVLKWIIHLWIIGEYPIKDADNPIDKIMVFDNGKVTVDLMDHRDLNDSHLVDIHREAFAGVIKGVVKVVDEYIPGAAAVSEQLVKKALTGGLAETMKPPTKPVKYGVFLDAQDYSNL